MPQFAPGRVTAAFAIDRLIAGDYPVVTRTETLLSGQSLTRGALLGKITADGKLTLSLSASSDGSQTPYAILADDVDATAGDKICGIYLSGEFDESQVVFGAGHTADSARAALRDANIYLKAALPA